MKNNSWVNILSRQYTDAIEKTKMISRTQYTLASVLLPYPMNIINLAVYWLDAVFEYDRNIKWLVP